MKRIISLVMAIAISLSVLIIPASATEIQGPVVQVIVGGDDMNDNMRAPNPPTTHHNLSDRSYVAELYDLAASKGSFTLYYFTTSTKKISLYCDLLRSGSTQKLTRKLEIRLYEKNANETSYHYLKSKNVEFTADFVTTVDFTSLNNDNFYYIRFVNNSSDDPADSLDISGKITISV